MTEAQPSKSHELEELLTERKKFEAWLSQLDARRESAATHVFERVHADYSRRLEEVRAKLAAEAGAIAALVEELEARLATEQEKVTQKSDERAEAELRALVGEYSEKEWNSTRSKLDSAIADRRAKFDTTERELAELRELLLNVHGTPASSRPSVMQAAAVSVEGDLEEATRVDESAREDEESVVDVIAVETVVAPDEITMVNEVGAFTDAPGDSSTEDAGPKFADADDAAPDASADEKPANGFDELAFLRSVAGTPSSPRGVASIGAKAPKPTDSSREPITEPPSRPRASSATSTESDEAPASPLGAPTPRTSQAIRSLKCQECGTLNFPTEWYCERCGGELAAF